MSQFLPVSATFVHRRGQQFGAGPLTHVPRRGDWVELGDESYAVVRVIWNLNQDPATVELLVDHIEEQESSLTLPANITLIQALNALEPE